VVHLKSVTIFDIMADFLLSTKSVAWQLRVAYHWDSSMSSCYFGKVQRTFVLVNAITCYSVLLP